MKTLSLGQAAKACDKSKATLSKALKSGKLSYISKSSAGYKIDPAELFRVFPKTVDETPKANDQNPTETANETAVYEARIKALQEMVDMLKADKEDWKHQAQAAHRMLENHSQNANKSRSGGLFGFLRGNVA